MTLSVVAPPPPAAALSRSTFSSSQRIRRHPRASSAPAISRAVQTGQNREIFGPAVPFLRCSIAGRLSLIDSHHCVTRNTKGSTHGITPSNDREEDRDKIVDVWKVETSSPKSYFLAKLAIALGIAATITLASICFKGSSGPSFALPMFIGGSSQPVPVAVPNGFTLTIFGYRIIIPEYTPGWVYFWLLMAAGCGLFISEEALNVWVGMSLARSLTLDGNWQSFAKSFSKNSPYILSTMLWVYWGVCISDMIPFYLGKLFRQTRASEDICAKLGMSKEKAVNITQLVQKYGNFIGFVERFSIGVRNPTAFLAGAWGISSEYFFAGVCCGGLITVPFQLMIGFLLRERPIVALASVATAVGVWTVFPYLIAASTALFLFIRRGDSNKKL